MTVRLTHWRPKPRTGQFLVRLPHLPLPRWQALPHAHSSLLRGGVGDGFAPEPRQRLGGGHTGGGDTLGEQALDLGARQPVCPVGLAHGHCDRVRARRTTLADRRRDDEQGARLLRRDVDVEHATALLVVGPLHTDPARSRGDVRADQLADLVAVDRGAIDRDDPVEDLHVVHHARADSQHEDTTATVGEGADVLGEFLHRARLTQFVRHRLGVQPLPLRLLQQQIGLLRAQRSTDGFQLHRRHPESIPAITRPADRIPQLRTAEDTKPPPPSRPL